MAACAAKLLEELPPGKEARFVLGDTHYNAPEVRELCENQGRILVASRHGPYPHTDPGVEVRRVFHELRLSGDRELQRAVQEHLRRGSGQVPTKGLVNTTRFALGAVLVYQMALLYQYEHGRDLRVGLKAFLKAGVRFAGYHALSESPCPFAAQPAHQDWHGPEPQRREPADRKGPLRATGIGTRKREWKPTGPTNSGRARHASARIWGTFTRV